MTHQELYKTFAEVCKDREAVRVSYLPVHKDLAQAFATQNPESLQRDMTIATKEGDLQIDGCIRVQNALISVYNQNLAATFEVIEVQDSPDEINEEPYCYILNKIIPKGQVSVLKCVVYRRSPHEIPAYISTNGEQETLDYCKQWSNIRSVRQLYPNTFGYVYTEVEVQNELPFVMHVLVYHMLELNEVSDKYTEEWLQRRREFMGRIYEFIHCCTAYQGVVLAQPKKTRISIDGVDKSQVGFYCTGSMNGMVRMTNTGYISSHT